MSSDRSPANAQLCPWDWQPHLPDPWSARCKRRKIIYTLQKLNDVTYGTCLAQNRYFCNPGHRCLIIAVWPKTAGRL